MSAIVKYRVLALTLCVSALGLSGLAGCAVQTASGDPTLQGEEGAAHAESTTSAGAQAGQTVQIPTLGIGVTTPRAPAQAPGRSGTESSADEVKAEAKSNCQGAGCATGSSSDNTQPLPWIDH